MAIFRRLFHRAHLARPASAPSAGSKSSADPWPSVSLGKNGLGLGTNSLEFEQLFGTWAEGIKVDWGHHFVKLYYIKMLYHMQSFNKIATKLSVYIKAPSLPVGPQEPLAGQRHQRCCALDFNHQVQGLLTSNVVCWPLCWLLRSVIIIPYNCL